MPDDNNPQQPVDPTQEKPLNEASAGQEGDEQIQSEPRAGMPMGNNGTLNGGAGEPKKSPYIYLGIVLVLVLVAALGAGMYITLMGDSEQEEELTTEETRTEEPMRVQEPEPTPDVGDNELTPGDSMEEIEQDLSTIEVDDLEDELTPIEQDIQRTEQ